MNLGIVVSLSLWISPHDDKDRWQGRHRTEIPTSDTNGVAHSYQEKTDQMRPRSKANAAAAVRDDTLSLAKMFCRWRRTVWPLMTSSVAIAWLLLPAATRRRTSTSRGLSVSSPAPRADQTS